MGHLLISDITNVDKQTFILKFSQIPAAFLCNLEYINQDRITQVYEEGIKEQPNGFFSDLVFFYMYLCFFQSSDNTVNLGPEGNCFVILRKHFGIIAVQFEIIIAEFQKVLFVSIQKI